MNQIGLKWDKIYRYKTRISGGMGGCIDIQRGAGGYGGMYPPSKRDKLIQCILHRNRFDFSYFFYFLCF